MNLYQRTFETAPPQGAIVQSVDGNLVEVSSAQRIEIFNGVKTIKYENEELAEKYNINTKNGKKHYKLIILIIASSAEHYNIFTKCWLEYMNKFDEVKSFFLYSDENIDTDIYITENAITYKCKESLIPGILYKTIAGYYFCEKKFTYDYILRTNLSSFIHIPRLLQYIKNIKNIEITNKVFTNLELIPLFNDDNNIALLETIEMMKQQNPNAIVPKNVIENWKNFTIILSDFFDNKDLINCKTFYFFPGSFFMISKNVINRVLFGILREKILEKANITTTPDDVAISAFVFKYFQNINTINTNDFSRRCENNETEYDDKIFHIRNRTDMYHGHRNIDVKNIINQVKKFYNENFEIVENE